MIFDTCTRPEYYQDVHNLLALPKGAVMRYEYRDEYLSEQAFRLAVDKAAAPARVLLVYAQRPGYTRGADNAQAPAEELQWVCTRFATMLAIPSTGGANFYFDFSVEGYPKLDAAALEKLLAPLIASSETPFQKWVAVSDDMSAYSDLNRGQEESNWEAIVDRISAKDMQFQADSFWRLRPFNAAAVPKLVPYVEQAGKVAELRQVSSRYQLFPDELCAFEAVSYSPAGRLSTQPSRELQVHFDRDGPVLLEGSASIDLRQYTGKILNFRARRPEEDRVAAAVRFETSSDQKVWPDGPNFELLFQVSRQAAPVPPPNGSKSAVAAAPAALPSATPDPAKAVAAGVGEPAAKLPNAQPRPEPPEPHPAPRPALEKLTPWFVLQAAIRATPVVKYGLGVAGLAAAAAIALSFFQSPGLALLGTAGVLVFAVLLFVFSSMTRAKASWPALFLTWSLTFLFVATLVLTISTVFFAFPLPYPKLLHQFQPARRATIAVTVEDKSTGSPIAGAIVALQNPEGMVKGFTTSEGKVSFHAIAIEEQPMAATVSAAGYQDSQVGLDATDPAASHVITLTRLPEVQPPPPKPANPVKKKPSPAAQKPPPTAIAAAPNMQGTWQVLAGGDINNLRLRNGTFQFQAQNDGEILVSANFVLDDMRVTLSGTATAVGPQVFLKFDAKNDAGGSWSGRANFRIDSPTRMSGNVEPKSGANVPITLKKLPQ